MVDYTRNEDYVEKDTLPTGDPEKLILGTDLQSEFDEIATSLITKLDVDDRATAAQAIEGVNNTSYMTPLRVAQLLQGDGTGAGIVTDLVGLEDPDGDRLLFWDDSEDAAGFLFLGNGLSIFGTTIAFNNTEVPHDSLAGVDENEHIDHTTVAVLAGPGLALTSLTDDLTDDFEYELDISGLTSVVITDVDNATDLVVFYDADADDHKVIPVQELVGAQLGHAGYWRSGDIALPTAANTATGDLLTIPYNTPFVADTLINCTFDPLSGILTAVNDTTLMVTAKVYSDAIGEGSSLIAHLLVNSARVDTNPQTSLAGFGGSAKQCNLAKVVELSAGDEVSVEVITDSDAGPNLRGSEELTHISFVEIA